MASQLTILMLATTTILQARAVTYSARITSGDCPSQEIQAMTRLQILNETSSLLRAGLTEDSPATSCNALPSYRSSGEYWILPATGPPAVQVYCDFNRQCGCDGPSTWTRVAFLNMSDPSHACPVDWLAGTSPVRACGSGLSTPGCSSVQYQTHGQQYQRVCGRVVGYQIAFTRAFSNLLFNSFSIDSAYLYGVSITVGHDGSRRHVWSFASAASELRGFAADGSVCSCSNRDSWPYWIQFVGSDYFCDSGNEVGNPTQQFYFDDPLWDGAGCGPSSTCCEFNNPPWFCKTLPRPATDDLEVRICEPSSNGHVGIELIELYIQ